MKLYHVSTNLNHSGVFYPRTPNERHIEHEDASYNRIALCENIKGCMTCLQTRGKSYNDVILETRGYFKVFEVDTKKLRIPKMCIVESNELYEKDLVRDALITNEHWITSSFQVPDKNAYIINVEDWELFLRPISPNESIRALEPKVPYEDMISYPRMEKVGCLDFSDSILKKGYNTTINYNHSSDELSYLSNYLECNFRIPKDIIIEMDYETFVIRANKKVDLKDFFLYHRTLIGN